MIWFQAHKSYFYRIKYIQNKDWIVQKANRHMCDLRLHIYALDKKLKVVLVDPNIQTLELHTHTRPKARKPKRLALSDARWQGLSCHSLSSRLQIDWCTKKRCGATLLTAYYHLLALSQSLDFVFVYATRYSLKNDIDCAKKIVNRECSLIM